ncbi:MAG: DUF3237 family protein [Anaerolineae bacterium]|nr:DUF3237 family protein [Anaerolineae bacterium]
MSDQSLAHGELLYELSLHFTQVIEYGVSFGALLAGQVAPPPEGARFDAYVAGTATGEKINAAVEAIDYITVRADGKFTLHIHGRMTTADGATIAFFIPGQGIPEPSGVAQLRELAEHHSSHEAYRWLNLTNAFIEGWANPATGELQLKAYAVM